MKKDKQPKTKKRFKWDRLFYNNRFVAVLSVLLAIVLWFVVGSNNTEDHPRAIVGVPLKITLSDTAQSEGLKVFQTTNSTASVYVKGNAAVVLQLQASDLVAYVPSASSITTPGNYSLPVAVRNSETNIGRTAYTVDHTDPQVVSFMVDRYREKTFNIESDITYKGGLETDSSYYVGSPVLTSDTVTIAGPEKEVNQVNRVAYQYEVASTPTESLQFTATLVLYDANGNKLDKGNMTVTPEKVDVTIPVLPRKTMSVTATFANKPSGLDISADQIKIQPSTIDIAAPKTVLDNMMGTISLDPVDFSLISPTHNSFDANITLPSSCKNLSNSSTARVTLDLSNMSTKQLVASVFNVKNVGTDRNATVRTTGLSVTAVGPPEELAKLTDTSVIGSVDLSDKQNFTGQTEVPVTFTISNSTKCWIYGNYKVSVTIASKNS
jgi:YbbR domain-containing protein